MNKYIISVLSTNRTYIIIGIRYIGRYVVITNNLLELDRSEIENSMYTCPK